MSSWLGISIVWVVSTLILWAWGGAFEPFGDTLALLPTVLLLFAGVDSRLGRRGRDPEGRLLLLLLLGLPFRHLLGWAVVDGVWAGLLGVVLALAVFRRLPALRRLLRSRDGASFPDLAFVLLPLAVYLAIQPWALDHRQPDGDEPYYLLITHSLVFDGDVDLGNNYAAEDSTTFMERAIGSQPGDPVGEDGEIYSRHAAFLPALLMPSYGLAGRAGVATTMALLSAALAFFTLALARRLWPEAPGGALLAWALLAFSPPLLVYAHQAWIEVPAALFTVLALGALTELRNGPADASAGSRNPWHRPLALLVICLVALVSLKLRLVLVALPLLVLALFSRGLPRRARLVMTGLPAAALLAILAYNLRVYGNPLRMYSTAEVDLYLGSFGPEAWARYARGGVGMFYDASFGLFASSPIWLLLLPGLAWLVLRRDRFLPLFAVATLPYLLAVAPRIEWYGGWSPPFRYPLVFLPLLALVLVPLLERRPPGLRLLASILLPITGVLALVWVVLPGTTYNLADGGSHLLHMASQQVGADVARLFPSSVRPRTATWIWPLLSLLAIPLAFVGAGDRRAASDGSASRGSLSARHRWAAIAPVVLGLVLGGLPWLAQALPTRVVELEDAWVTKSGGSLHPDRWTPQRPAYRGGWLLASRTTVQIPVVVGGDQVRLRIHARRRGQGPKILQVRAGGHVLAEVVLERRKGWRAVEVGPVDWPAGEPLVLHCPEIRARQEIGILVDRIELEWQ